MTRRQTLRVLAALAVTVAATHVAVVFGGGTFGLRDHLTYTVPSRTHLHQAVTQGQFPGWWPAVGLGIPFAANPVHQALAPVGVLCALLPMPFGADVEPLVYLVIMGAGAALLAARLGSRAPGAFVAGSVLVTSGYAESLIVNGNLPHIAWIPWLAWAGDRLGVASGTGWRSEARSAIALAVIGALQCAAPEPAAALTGAGLAVVTALARATSRRRAFAWLGVAGVSALGLAAATLVPAYLLSARTARAGGFDLATAAEWSLHPLRLLELAWPQVLGDPLGARANLTQLVSEATLGGQEPAWSYSLFLGVPVLVLAAFGAARRRAWALVAAALVLVVLASGRHTPLFGAWRAVFPPERYLRYPEKHVIGALVVACVLAGLGFERLVTDGAPRRQSRIVTAVALLTTAIVSGVTAWRPSLVEVIDALPRPPGTPVDGAAGLAVAIRGGWVAVASAWGLVAAARVRARPWNAALALVACLAPLAWNVHGLLVVVPRDQVRRAPALVSAVRAADGSPAPRVYLPAEMTSAAVDRQNLAAQHHRLAEGNFGTTLGLQVLPGVEPTFDVTYRYFWGDQFPRMPIYAFATLLGVRWVALDEFRYPQPFPGPVVIREPPLNVVDFAPVRARAFVAGDFAFVESVDEALRTFGAPDRAAFPAAVVLASSPDAVPAVAPGGPPGACTVSDDAPERVVLDCSSPGGGFAVLLDAAAPGWSAEVDGTPTTVLTADALFRAVPVGPGAHRVTFEYSTPGLGVGLAVSAATALGLATLWVGSRRQRPMTAA